MAAPSAECAEFLRTFLDRVGTLPGEIRRNLTLVGELDEASRGLVAEIHSLQHTYIRKAKKRASEPALLGLDALERANKDKAVLTRIQSKREDATIKADEKISLATQVYELVDRHIKQLDVELKGLEVTMRASGQLGMSADLTSAGAGKSKSSSKHRESLLVPEDAPIDPNEPVYCTCRRVAFGDMIGCDNDDCLVEWFHFACVGLKAHPNGQWFCDACKAKMQPRKKRRRR